MSGSDQKLNIWSDLPKFSWKYLVLHYQLFSLFLWILLFHYVYFLLKIFLIIREFHTICFDYIRFLLWLLPDPPFSPTCPPSCTYCHNHHEFLCAAALLCPRNTVAIHCLLFLQFFYSHPFLNGPCALWGGYDIFSAYRAIRLLCWLPSTAISFSKKVWEMC